MRGEPVRNERSARRVGRLLSRSALIVGFLVAAGTADARTVNLRWTHPSPGDVDAFYVFFGDAPGDYTSTQNAAIPPVVAGIFEYALEVDDSSTVHVCVKAFSTGGGFSTCSNEIVRLPGLGAPGQPQVVLP